MGMSKMAVSPRPRPQKRMSKNVSAGSDFLTSGFFTEMYEKPYREGTRLRKSWNWVSARDGPEDDFSPAQSSNAPLSYSETME